MIDGDSDEGSLEQKLRELELQFAARLPAKMLEIKQMMQKCIDERPDLNNFSLLHRLLHSLAGSAGIFGFVELGQRAQVLEIAVKKFLDLPSWSQPALEKIAQDLDTLAIWAEQNADLPTESPWLK